MSLVFADAGYWIALWSRSDGLHRRAAALAERFVGSETVTTGFVLIEVLDGFSDLGGMVDTWQRLWCMRFRVLPI